ncbi:MAG TPA: YdeI/OmpD-associated family protein [Streptosporangiaceae bacterium]|jgi:uncharacterized protein YdeI (YjbR/CyaY-like superfamily)
MLGFSSAAAWSAWLEENHEGSAGLWLKIAKKGAPSGTVSYAEAIEVALCFGWIDGQKGAIDEHYWRQRFTPRRTASKWSKINREKAEQLIAAGLMRPAGLRQVSAAQEDGRWSAAYEGQAAATVPADLALALEGNPEAAAFFATLTGANRYAILYRIQDAKRAQTRAARIEKFVAMCAAHETIHGAT